MIAATRPRWPRDSARLLVIDSGGAGIADSCMTDLPDYFAAGDLLVVNDAATLPASFQVRTPSGQTGEVRLAGRLDEETWRAVLFGPGDWRVRARLQSARAKRPTALAGNRREPLHVIEGACERQQGSAGFSGNRAADADLHALDQNVEAPRPPMKRACDVWQLQDRFERGVRILEWREHLDIADQFPSPPQRAEG